MTKRVRPLLCLIAFLLSCLPSFAQGTEIMFQAFTWNGEAGGPGNWYAKLKEVAPEVSELGATHIWFPPPSRSLAKQGYLPLDYYDVGSHHSPTFYGHYDSLKAAVGAYNELGIKTIADVVVNHRCANKQQDGQWNVYHYPSNKAVWERWALARGDYGGTGANDTGDDYGAAPDIDHTNEQVRKDIIEWLKWLRDDIGFRGWRLDFAKGYGPSYAQIYSKSTDSAFTVAEVWTSMDYDGSSLKPNQNGHRQYLCNYLDGANGLVSAFDFTTKGILQVACARGEYWRLQDSEGRPSGLIGWWPSKAVTLIDNHDTGSAQNHWPFPGHQVAAGYAYILTHPGTPSIFWDHYFQWGPEMKEQIKHLASLRHEQGIRSSSRVKILRAEQSMYLAIIDDKTMVKLGPAHYSPDSSWTHRLSGKDYQVWLLK